MMIGLVLALSLVAEPQRPQGPPPTPVDVSAIASHVARLTVLEGRKQELESKLMDARRQFGESHPEVAALREQLDVAEKALANEGFNLREEEIDRVAERIAKLEGELKRDTETFGPRHPQVLNTRSDIDMLTAQLAAKTKALLESGLEQSLVATTSVKGSTDLGALLQLARLYAAAGRTADAERVLTNAIALVRSRK
jgi:uncharacterized protein involved in exopolysaccharide biosynthesis